MNIATYSYDNGNRVDTRTYQNGVVADYTYDANNRITHLEHSRASVSLAAFAHAYDNEGNKLYEDQQHNPIRSEGYQYDSIYRLVDYKVGPLVAGTVPVPTTQTAYNLDAVGNWDSKTTDAVTETRTHNAANEITQIDTQAITHDNNGNLIQDANYDYTFDENNRLIQVNSPQSTVISQYSYDALGRRISKDVSGTITVFLYDNARIIEERDGSNNVQATYTYGNYIDEVLTMDRASQRYFYHQNALWSVHALTDAAGAVVERYTYDAYGALTVLDPLFVTLNSAPLAYFTYTGREFDAETGLYHYRARTYGAALGRFYSRDPLMYVDGMNLYEYVRGNPVWSADPTGLFPIQLKFAAFIPKSKGGFVLGVPSSLDSVQWGIVPGQWPWSGTKKFFSTDDRELAGEPGTSRVYTIASFDSSDIGNLQGNITILSDADFSHEIKAEHFSSGEVNSVSGWQYVNNSLKQDKAVVGSGHYIEDASANLIPGVSQDAKVSRIFVNANGSYPFSMIAPAINYNFSWTIARCGDGNVQIYGKGSHNEFPAYEAIGNGKVHYSDYPTSSGPSIPNLGIFWDNFSYYEEITQ